MKHNWKLGLLLQYSKLEGRSISFVTFSTSPPPPPINLTGIHRRGEFIIFYRNISFILLIIHLQQYFNTIVPYNYNVLRSSSHQAQLHERANKLNQFKVQSGGVINKLVTSPATIFHLVTSRNTPDSI